MMRWEEHTYGVHILKLVQAPHLCPSSIRFFVHVFSDLQYTVATGDGVPDQFSQ